MNQNIEISNIVDTKPLGFSHRELVTLRSVLKRAKLADQHRESVGKQKHHDGETLDSAHKKVDDAIGK